MSSIIKNKYKLVLWQAGLSQDYTYFAESFKEIKKLDCKHYIYFEDYNQETDYIDMDYFDVKKNKFYYLLDNEYNDISNNAKKEFNKKIIRIIDLLKKNEEKVLHIRTNLSNSFNLKDKNDPIKNQSLKLKYIIETILSYGLDIDISLVGHSQGGLVNLETTLLIPKLIKNLISIQTPYKPVYFAKIKNLFNSFVNDIPLKNILFYPDIKEKRYQNSIEILQRNSYFSSLKNKWKQIKNKRPNLTIIVAVSGKYKTISPKIFFDIRPIKTHEYLNYFNVEYEFDGLLFIDEQTDIDYDLVFRYTRYDEISIINDGLSYLFNKKNNKKLICYPVKEYGKFYSKGENVSESISETINLATYGCAITHDNNYKHIYDLYASRYSHKYLSYEKEVILNILGVLD